MWQGDLEILQMSPAVEVKAAVMNFVVVLDIKARRMKTVAVNACGKWKDVQRVPVFEEFSFSRARAT